MSTDMQHRHGISDEAWALLEPILPSQRGQWGGIAKDNRFLSTLYFGFCEHEYPGVICHLLMENGVPFISIFVDDVMQGPGKSTGSAD